MTLGDADVLVEMEQLDALPVDVRSCGQRLEEFELRGAGGGDDPGLAAPGDRRDEGSRRRDRLPPRSSRGGLLRDEVSCFSWLSGQPHGCFQTVVNLSMRIELKIFQCLFQDIPSLPL